MANKTKQQERDRRAKIEAMRKAEQAKERRKSLLFIVIAAVVGLGLVAAAAIPAYLDSRNDPANFSLYNTRHTMPELLYSDWVQPPPEVQPLMKMVQQLTQ